MTLMQLCALVPPMCRMGRDPDVRHSLEAFRRHDDPAPLSRAMLRHPEDSRRVMTLMGSGDPPTTESLRRRFTQEALAFFHLCGQCAPEELLCVLTRCTTTPTAEALSLLIGERRREQAAQLYGLQLLWRMNGDNSLPDAFALFAPSGAPAPNAADVIRNTIRHLKGGRP